MTAWQIYAMGDHYHEVDSAPPDLLPLVRACTGNVPRRVGRFIQLALLGALRCRQQHALPRETAVYLSSARGDLQTMIEILQELFRDGRVPKPLQFINTVSNAACFHIAQSLGLQSRSNFICNRHSAFESALQLATLDLALGDLTSALVGSVDIATAPLPEHRRRLGLAVGAAVGEGSHWLWLGVQDSQRPRLGELHAARHFPDRDALLLWLDDRQLPAGRCQLSVGQFMAAADVAAVCEASGITDVLDCRQGRAYYDSQSGAVIGEFLRGSASGSLLHVNADPPYSYSVLLLER